MRAVGYRQVWRYLDGEYSAPEMVERGVIATRQLAKRQMTWLRGWEGVHWLESSARDNLPRALKYLDRLAILSGHCYLTGYSQTLIGRVRFRIINEKIL